MRVQTLPYRFQHSGFCFILLLLVRQCDWQMLRVFGVQLKMITVQPLAFTTIFVKQTGSGTTTNVNGSYEITLPPGQYEIVFQYLGYETVVKQVEISNDIC